MWSNIGNPPLYWWTQTVAEIRRNCLQTKRKLTRANKRRDVKAIQKAKTEYKEARKNLKLQIKRKKELL
jgi:hypothetical protein